MNEKALDSILIHLCAMGITPQFIRHQMHISETQWQLNSAGKGIPSGRAETASPSFLHMWLASIKLPKAQIYTHLEGKWERTATLWTFLLYFKRVSSS